MSSDATIAGYCRACGKALNAQSLRSAHGTIYCEEHVPREQMTNEQSQSQPGSAGAAHADASPYSATTPPPIPNPEVSPGLAFLLGLIPGVGAIYNSQYAKGLAHVAVVGMLITILSNGAANGLEPLVSLLLVGFWAYMPFEAFHTASKRRNGLAVDEFSSLAPLRGGSRLHVAPVVMIVLGVIFLLNNLEILELRRILRYWPVMMIALGVYLLYLRISAQDNRGDRQ